MYTRYALLILDHPLTTFTTRQLYRLGDCWNTNYISLLRMYGGMYFVDTIWKLFLNNCWNNCYKKEEKIRGKKRLLLVVVYAISLRENNPNLLSILIFLLFLIHNILYFCEEEEIEKKCFFFLQTLEKPCLRFFWLIWNEVRGKCLAFGGLLCCLTLSDIWTFFNILIKFSYELKKLVWKTIG